MKAKEYVKMFEEHPCETVEDKYKIVNKVFKLFLQEFTDLTTTRGNNHTTLTGILNELDNKWRAVASKVNIIKSDGFRLMLIKIDPNIAILANWTVNKI